MKKFFISLHFILLTCLLMTHSVVAMDKKEQIIRERQEALRQAQNLVNQNNINRNRPNQSGTSTQATISSQDDQLKQFRQKHQEKHKKIQNEENSSQEQLAQDQKSTTSVIQEKIDEQSPLLTKFYNLLNNLDIKSVESLDKEDRLAKFIEILEPLVKETNDHKSALAEAIKRDSFKNQIVSIKICINALNNAIEKLVFADHHRYETNIQINHLYDLLNVLRTNFGLPVYEEKTVNHDTTNDEPLTRKIQEEEDALTAGALALQSFTSETKDAETSQSPRRHTWKEKGKDKITNEEESDTTTPEEKEEKTTEEENQCTEITPLACGTLSEKFPQEILILILEKCLEGNSSTDFVKSALHLRHICKTLQQFVDCEILENKESLNNILQKIGLPPLDLSPYALRKAIKSNNLGNICLLAKLDKKINDPLPDKYDSESKFKEYPLMFSVKKKFTKIVKLLLDLDANPNTIDHKGESALFHAVRFSALWNYIKFPKIVKILLDGGASVNLKNKYNMTPVYSILHDPHVRSPLLDQTIKIISLFLEKGWDLNEGIDNFPLLKAVERNDIKLVKFLLQQADIDVNKATSLGKTALMEASLSRCFLEILGALLCHKSIDINRKDILGRSALSLACEAKNINEVRLLLLSNNIDLSQDLIDTLKRKNGDREIIDLLEKHLAKKQEQSFSYKE